MDLMENCSKTSSSSLFATNLHRELCASFVCPYCLCPCDDENGLLGHQKEVHQHYHQPSPPPKNHLTSFSPTKKRNKRILADRNINILHTKSFDDIKVKNDQVVKPRKQNSKIVEASAQDEDGEEEIQKQSQKELCKKNIIPVGDTEVLKWLIKKLKAENKSLNEQVGEINQLLKEMNIEKQKTENKINETELKFDNAKLVLIKKENDYKDLVQLNCSLQTSINEMIKNNSNELQNLEQKYSNSKFKISLMDRLLSQTTKKLYSNQLVMFEQTNKILNFKIQFEIIQKINEKNNLQNETKMKSYIQMIQNKKKEILNSENKYLNKINEINDSNCQKEENFITNEKNYQKSIIIKNEIIKEFKHNIYDLNQKMIKMKISFENEKKIQKFQNDEFKKLKQDNKNKLFSIDKEKQILIKQNEIKTKHINKLIIQNQNFQIEKSNLESINKMLLKTNQKYMLLIQQRLFYDMRKELHQKFKKDNKLIDNKLEINEMKSQSLKSCLSGLKNPRLIVVLSFLFSVLSFINVLRTPLTSSADFLSNSIDNRVVPSLMESYDMEILDQDESYNRGGGGGGGGGGGEEQEEEQEEEGGGEEGGGEGGGEEGGGGTSMKHSYAEDYFVFDNSGFNEMSSSKVSTVVTSDNNLLSHNIEVSHHGSHVNQNLVVSSRKERFTLTKFNLSNVLKSWVIKLRPNIRTVFNLKNLVSHRLTLVKRFVSNHRNNFLSKLKNKKLEIRNRL